MSSSTTSSAPTTIQYRLDLAHALAAVSPALSALHAARAAALHPEISAVLHPSHCPKCGTYRFSGNHPIHPPTKKRKRARSSRSKSLQTKCHLCGSSADAGEPIGSPLTDNLPVPVRAPSSFPRTGATPSIDGTGQESPLANTLLPAPETVPMVTPAPLLAGQQYRPKSSAKASALRDMLSRDRQRERGVKARKEKEDSHEGLAAFLKQL